MIVQCLGLLRKLSKDKGKPCSVVSKLERLKRTQVSSSVWSRRIYIYIYIYIAIGSSDMRGSRSAGIMKSAE